MTCINGVVQVDKGMTPAKSCESPSLVLITSF